jgi:hypothetical protein
VEERWCEEEEMADAIIRYLAEHPQASDTLEGIAEWWIMRRQVRVEINKLKKALHRLTERGLLEKIGTGDNAQYRLKAKAGEPHAKEERRR